MLLAVEGCGFCPPELRLDTVRVGPCHLAYVVSILAGINALWNVVRVERLALGMV